MTALSQSSFGGVQKSFWESVLWCVSSPIRFAPPHITAQVLERVGSNWALLSDLSHAPCVEAVCHPHQHVLFLLLSVKSESEHWFLSQGQGAPKGRQQKGETGPGTHIFAAFCRFSLIFGSLCKSRDLGVADLRRKPQETADFRRKPQKTADFCRNRFLPFAVSLKGFWRAPTRDSIRITVQKFRVFMNSA